MLFAVGAVVVLVCVLGGFYLHGGNLAVLWQPTEFLVIGGAAIGAFIISNPKQVIIGTGAGVKAMLSGPKYNKESYIELLSLLYQIFKLIKSKGMLVIEQHVENPHESELFAQFPNFTKNHHNLEFVCDYLRMMTLGAETPNEMEDLMNDELDTHHEEMEAIPTAIQTTADALPALGIVAAVLGVINTMGSLTEPPEVLGYLIGAALVGTFLGVFASYGFVAPIANSVKSVYAADAKYLQCIKVGLLAHLNGSPPAVSIEFARKTLMSDIRPTFYEVEDAVSLLPAAA